MLLGCSKIFQDILIIQKKKKNSPSANWSLLNKLHFAMFMKLENV